MAAEGGAGSCLSDLSDDLLRHILSFAPASDRAATAVLSRRWLRLWRTSGDVYLDSRSFNDDDEAFLRGADKALAAAAHGPIKRLTFSLAENSKMDWRSVDKLIDAVVSNPAARRVEELKIEVKPLDTRCTVSFGSLPSEALRELRLINCSTLTAPPPGAAAAAAFPMLVALHIEHCVVSLVDLQTIIDAAPRLSKLHLESSCVNMDITAVDDDGDEQLVRRLIIPGVTDLVLADCEHWYDELKLEMDVPRLQYFRYRGNVQQTDSLSLKLQATSNLRQVDLYLTDDYQGYSDDTPIRNTFWQFIQNFKTTKRLKIKLDDFFSMDELALEDNASRDELLGGLSFDLLKQLELEAQYKYEPGFETSMVMLANLLQCCPMVRDLRFRFSKHYENEMSWMNQSSTDKEARLHFDKSVNGFRNHRRKSMASLGGQNDVNYEGLSIPGLSGEHSFSCLQRHLQRVSLHFFMDDPNCIEVQLAKFFAENAMVLQEMHIDDGSQEMLEHVNSSLRRWIANTHKGNNQLNVKD